MTEIPRYLTRSKGCPFCGYKPSIVVDPVGGVFLAVVSCPNNRCLSAEAVRSHRDAKKAAANVTAAWNNRDVGVAHDVVRQFDRIVARERERVS